MLPGEQSSVVVKDYQQIEWLKQNIDFSDHIGIPFWFRGNMNVFGNRVRIVKSYFNPNGTFARLWVVPDGIFRIHEYYKYKSNALPDAHIHMLKQLEAPVKDHSINLLFEEYCNAVSLMDFKHVSLLDLILELALGTEASLAIISLENQWQREDLMKRVLTFKLRIKEQSKTFISN